MLGGSDYAAAHVFAEKSINHLGQVRRTHWERAIVPGLIQLVLIGLLGVALFGYLQQHFGKLLTLAALLLSEVAAVAYALGVEISRGLGEYGDACRSMLGTDYSDAFLASVRFFELYQFAIVSFVALMVGTLVLVICSGVVSLTGRLLKRLTVRRETDRSP